MNVRFFAGTKKQYLSLPFPRNPLGLYFCEDTKELFWADNLLTDGVRVVPTYDSLPTLATAADGVVYYVTETRNGYTLSPDRAKWLQTIYAPATDAYKVPESEIYNTVTTVGAVRDIEAKIYKTIEDRIANIEIGDSGSDVVTISFAGVPFTEVNGVFTLDRANALKALGFKVAGDVIPEEIAIATESFVEQKIAEASFNTEIFATKNELTAAIDAIEHPAVDLSAYATKIDVNNKADKIHYHAEYLTEHQSLAGLATESYVTNAVNNLDADITNYVNAAEVRIGKNIPTAVGQLINDKGYITISDVPKTDLTDYAKKSDIPTVPTKASAFENDLGYITDIPDIYITEAELSAKNYLTEHQSLANYATKSFVANAVAENQPNLAKYALKTDIPDTSEFITSIPAEYVTERELAAKGYLTQDDIYSKADKVHIHPEYLTEQDLFNYATKTFVKNAIAEAELNDKEIDLTGFATKDDLNGLVSEDYVNDAISKIEIPSVAGFATETYVNDKFAEIEVPTKVSELDNDTGYATKAVFTHKVQSLSATYFTNDFTDYINCATDKSLVIECGNAVYSSVRVLSQVQDTYILSFFRDNNELVKITLTVNDDYGTANAFKWECKPDIISKIASEQFVKDSIEALELPETDLSNYYNKSETETLVSEAINGIEIPEAELYRVDFNAPNFTEATDAYNAGKVLVLTNAAPDINSYAVMNYVSDSYITFTKFLTSRSEAYGSFNTYYLSTENTWEISKEVRLNKVEANVEGEVTGDLNTIRIGKEVYRIPVGGTDVNLDNYYTKDEVDTLIPDATNLVTKTEFELVQQQSAGNNIKIFQLDEEIIDINQRIDAIPTVDLAGYATEDFVTEKVNSIVIPDTDLSNYYNKEETEEFVAEAVSAIEVPDVDLSAYSTTTEMQAAITSAIQNIEFPEGTDLTGYATEEWVENKKYLTEHQDLSAYAKKTDIPTNYLTSIPDEYVTEAELTNKGYITDVSNKADTEHKHSLTDIEDYVAQDLSEYAKLSDIPDINAKADAIHTHFINDIIDYVAPEIPSLEGYATKQDVTDAISNIDFPEVPEVNLDNYYTKAETADIIADAIAVKANDVLFTTDKFVNNAVGAFSVGDNLNGFTIAEILAKLLGLTDKLPDEPDVPDEPENNSIITNIIENKIPMYQLASNGALTALTYSDIITITAEEDALQQQPKPTQSGFYRIFDSNNEVIEYGYQQVQVKVPYVPFMIALPEFINYTTDVAVEMYRELDSSWQTTNLVLISDMDEIAMLCDDEDCEIPEVPNGYTLWVSKDAKVMSSNTVYRFIITDKEI